MTKIFVEVEPRWYGCAVIRTVEDAQKDYEFIGKEEKFFYYHGEKIRSLDLFNAWPIYGDGIKLKSFALGMEVSGMYSTGTVVLQEDVELEFSPAALTYRQALLSNGIQNSTLPFQERSQFSEGLKDGCNPTYPSPWGIKSWEANCKNTHYTEGFRHGREIMSLMTEKERYYRQHSHAFSTAFQP
jgi:hypothetical protein